MSGGFFGLVLQPGKTYEQINELPLRLTMASIGPDDKGETGTKKTYLKYRSDEQEFVVCCLIPDKNETQVLELLFEPGEPLTFLTTGDCTIHLVGHYLVEDYPSMGDSDEECDEDYSDDMRVDEEIDSDEAGDIDPKIFGDLKKGASRQALRLARKAAVGDDSEENDDDEAEDGEELDEMDEDDLLEGGSWMDEDDEDDDEEVNDLDLFRLAAGIKRKANGKVAAIPPAGKKAKIVEIIEEEPTDNMNTTPDDVATLSNTPSLVSSDAEPKKSDATTNSSSNSTTNNNKNKKKKQKKAAQAGNKDENKEQTIPKPESKEVGEAKSESNEGKAVPAANGTDSKNNNKEKHQKEANGEKKTPLSAKAVAKQMLKGQQANGASTPSEKANSDTSPTKSTEAKDQNNNANKQKLKKTLPSGLQFEDVCLGDGARAKNGKRVSVRYIGKLVSNGKVFDSNTKGEPFKFQLGKREVIRGWDIGIGGMNVGGTRKITIPPALAYGARGTPPDIPPNATLEFEVKLLDVK
ncbi:hypothetical protein SeMB42_g04056 [Synchytrium endobioticum]|uniref:peptidylprolyl isomerase n=1 Tax=Synchytrium endobioticum TaxID=286115 RepID=A0A507DHC2_9FUNG|nr:hypothetical protein SeMB42_g04056 [Synchytrium endobioticum]TPX50984.1 hypothetical protein SeLEV6574_g00587 [Synchytrium endobioticum]